MATEYEVCEYKMDGGELDTFYKLFWFGSQDDGDLPAKSGMSQLIEKGLAVKNYNMPKIVPTEKPNGLSIKGSELATRFYHKEFKEMRYELGQTRIQLEHKTTLLASCEKALEDRDV